MDSTASSGGQDRLRINVHQDHELHDWAKKFNVTPEQIKEAVEAVGDRAADVEQHLTGSRATTNQEQTAAAR